MLDTPILTAVTPQDSKDDSCTFYRGTEYDGHLLIVAVCKTFAGGGNEGICLTTTRLYYLDEAADVTPDGTDFRDGALRRRQPGRLQVHDAEGHVGQWGPEVLEAALDRIRREGRHSASKANRCSVVKWS